MPTSNTFLKKSEKIISLNRIYALIVRDSRKSLIGDYIPQSKYKNIPVYVSDNIQIPMVMGFKKSVLLPTTKLSKEEVINILHHELQHIENRDIYIKTFINLLIVIYWWFHPIYRSQKEVDLFLEIRVDDKVTKKMSKENEIIYSETLIAVQKRIVNDSFFKEKELSCLLIDGNTSFLKYRIPYLMEGTYKKRTNKFLLASLFLIPFLSNSIILETYYSNPSEQEDGLFSDEEIASSYIIEHPDGTYTWYFSDNKQAEIIDPSSLVEEEGVSIVKERK